MAAPLKLPRIPRLGRMPHCEIPDEEGRLQCQRPARRVIRIVGKTYEYPVVACEECATYLEREARIYAARDR